MATDPAHYQDGIPNHFATNHRHSRDASYTSPHYVTCVSTTSLRLQQFFYSCATKWSTDCEVKAMTQRATLKYPLQSLRGYSLALLHFSQLGAEYSSSTETFMIQSDTACNGGVTAVRPHYNTFCNTFLEILRIQVLVSYHDWRLPLLIGTTVACTWPSHPSAHVRAYQRRK